MYSPSFAFFIGNRQVSQNEFEEVEYRKRNALAVIHSATQAGISLTVKSSLRRAYNNNNPMPCLHGNFRLGQLHLKATFTISTCVWYGLLPLPWHSPQSASSFTPLLTHLAGFDNSFPDFLEDSSGARASTCSSDSCKRNDFKMKYKKRSWSRR